MTRSKELSLMLTILLIAGAITLCLPVAEAANTVLDTSPDPVIIDDPLEYNTNFVLTVRITDVEDLFGFDFNITWDKTLITYVSDDIAGLDTIWPQGKTVPAHSNGASWYKLAASALGGAGYTNPSTQGMFTITFKALGPICNSVRETAITFSVHKLSNSVPAAISHTVNDGLYRIQGKTPILNLSEPSRQCRILNEPFHVHVGLADAEVVMGFSIDLRFNTTYLDCVSAAFESPWTGAPPTVNEGAGTITGSATVVVGQNGTVPVMTITLESSYPHIWKDASITGWTNDLTCSVYTQAATLTYYIAPDLTYTRGGGGGITVPVEVAYTFSPIKGDLDNNGIVEVTDLSYFGHYYDYREDLPGWSSAEPWDLVHIDGLKTIDIYDIIVFSSNFGATYSPPPP